CWNASMRCERVELGGDPAATAPSLRALVPAKDTVAQAVAGILADVRSRGDAALAEYTRSFDTGGAEPSSLVVEDSELTHAAESLAPAVRAGLEMAIDHVRQVSQRALANAPAQTITEMPRHAVTQREEPLHRAGVYVPGGRAPYPSTVVMG